MKLKSTIFFLRYEKIEFWSFWIYVNEDLVKTRKMHVGPLLDMIAKKSFILYTLVYLTGHKIAIIVHSAISVSNILHVKILCCLNSFWVGRTFLNIFVDLKNAWSLISWYMLTTWRAFKSYLIRRLIMRFNENTWNIRAAEKLVITYFNRLNCR